MTKYQLPAQWRAMNAGGPVDIFVRIATVGTKRNPEYFTEKSRKLDEFDANALGRAAPLRPTHPGLAAWRPRDAADPDSIAVTIRVRSER